MSFQLQFLGAAGTVTGSKYLVTYNGKKILVDCGLFQGLKSLRLQNWAALPVDPSTIDAVILTHAHIDHSGYIPLLIKNGFEGPIYATEATRDVCQILLPDSGYLQEEEAAYLNKRNRSKHSPALPLFTLEEAEDSIEYFHAVPFNETVSIGPGISFSFHYAGHILGAASIQLTLGQSRITFTGDLGRTEDAIFRAPDLFGPTDYLVTESTYGNRKHADSDLLDDIEAVVNRTHKRGGVIVIPAFAVGRAHSLMFALSELRRQNRIPKMPMFLNSPMASDFSKIFLRHKRLHKLTDEQCRQMSAVMTYITSPEESKALNEAKGPMLIISASGMLTGGRVLHHLKAFASDPANAIVLSGFQSAGTRGAALLNGAKEIKIHGEYVPVGAKVVSLDNISAHADYSEMTDHFRKSKISPRKVFVTHGEPSAADEFRRRLEETFSWDCVVPDHNEIVRLE